MVDEAPVLFIDRTSDQEEERKVKKVKVSGVRLATARLGVKYQQPAGVA